MSVDPLAFDLRPGHKVGEYEVQKLLGRGGMGAVYLGVQPQIGKKVAIKVLSQAAVGPEAAARFLREAQVVNRIGHPGLIDIFSFGQLPGGQHYLVMELLHGESLAARLARGPFGWPELYAIFSQMLSGLQAAHDHGVVHRDLKPDNVFLTTGEGGLRVKLLDFGLAKVLDDNMDMTQTGIALGTPRYMAPEQSRGGRHVDHRADLYAVGLMMYEAVTGHFPFKAQTPLLMLTIKLSQDPAPPSQLALLPQALEEVILRALQRRPEQRFQSAREMALALQAVADPTAPIALERRAAPSALPTLVMESLRSSSAEEATQVEASRWPALADDSGLTEEATRVEDAPQRIEGVPADLLRAAQQVHLPAPPRASSAGLPPPRSSAPGLQPPQGGPMLEGESTRLSAPPRRRAPSSAWRVVLVAGLAVLLGALCALALHALLHPPKPGPAVVQPAARAASPSPSAGPAPAPAPVAEGGPPAPSGMVRPARPPADAGSRRNHRSP
ncbi:MAG: serine/threonine-protein kinase [Myxococcales bacterium]|nr:serine/threonine protein kinase [Myxococcota bacterium]MDW8283420.1 serine/threonine-protein kinase [Myxococcales bacterium]